jgi:DNA-directed RNA polymerase specialized sigma24 family protein
METMSNDFYDASFKPEDFLERKRERMYPSPEWVLMREAVKYLTPTQRKLWGLLNDPNLTQKEIADKAGVSQSGVAKAKTAIEKKIHKWCKSNMGVYKLLKKEYQHE